MVTPTLTLAWNTLDLTQHPQPWLSQHGAQCPLEAMVGGAPRAQLSDLEGVGPERRNSELIWPSTWLDLHIEAGAPRNNNVSTLRGGEGGEVQETEAPRARGEPAEVLELVGAPAPTESKSICLKSLCGRSPGHQALADRKQRSVWSA